MKESEAFNLFREDNNFVGGDLPGKRAYMSGPALLDPPLSDFAVVAPGPTRRQNPVVTYWKGLSPTTQEMVFLTAILVVWTAFRSAAGIQALTFLPIIRATRSGGKVAGFLLALVAASWTFGVEMLLLGHQVNFMMVTQLGLRWIAYIGTISLVDSMVNRLQKSENMALTDPLTGALNRLGFAKHMETTLSRALVGGRPAIVAVVDLDDFKTLNDVHGHQFGDEILRTLVSCVQPALACGNGMLGRTGGDEFQIVFTDESRVAVEEALARAAMRFSDQTLVLGHRSTFSYGLAETEVVGFQASKLIEAADNEMYHRKATRNFSRGLRLV